MRYILILVVLKCIFFQQSGYSTPFPANYSVSNPELEEEVHVHLSNNWFISGEDLWMKVSVFLKGKPSPSVVAYAELLDRIGNPVKQEILELVNGLGEAYLEIPQSLASDNYLLRVYTRNSSNSYNKRGIFQKIITVIHPQIPPATTCRAGMQEDSEYADSDGHNAIQVEKTQYAQKDSVNLWLKIEPNTAFTISVSQIPSQQPYDLKDVNLEDIYDQTENSNVFIPEIYGHIIRGKSLASQIDTTESFYLSAHGMQSNLFLSKPLPSADLFFETGSFKHFDYVIIQSSNPDNPLDFVLESPFWEVRPIPNFKLPELCISEADREYILDRLLSSSVKSYYFPDKEIALKEIPPLINPDRSYLLDDYNRFEDMTTVIREYVPEVYVRSQNKKTVFRNMNFPYKSLFRNNPLILIDAMPVFDSDVFSRFHPKDIKKMDILNRHFYFQKDVYEGVIQLTSFKNNFGGFDLPTNALFIEYQGIQYPKNPEVSQQNKGERFPDFRSLLYWNSMGVTDDQGNMHQSFYTSEIQGTFEIKVSYWSKNQRWMESTKIIRVN